MSCSLSRERAPSVHTHQRNRHSLTINWTLALLFILSSIAGYGQTISGTVYRDFNSDGAYSSIPSSGTYAYGEPGVGGVLVKAYNASGVVSASAISSTATASLGSYTLTVGNTNAYRVEFTIPSVLNYLNNGFRTAGGSGTSVQFVNGGATGVHFGVSSSTDYCQPAPPLAVPCYVSGDPLSTTATTGLKDAHVLVSVPYTSAGTTISATSLANADEIGSVWGAAFQRETKKLFTAAFLKRHVGLGPGGLGGIYVTNTSTGTNALYVDLENAPFNLDLGQSTIAGRTLPGSPTTSSTDPLAFDAVGKIGLGGLALSSDGTTLYAIDLKNQQLLALAIGNPAKTTFSAGDLTKIAIPDPGCTNGVGRPFAIDIHNGTVYIGVVCTGEYSATTVTTADNLAAYVYAMPEGATTISATPEFTFRLNYNKGRVHTGDAALGDNWEPWASTFDQIHQGVTLTAGTRTGRPQPMLTDLGFTDNGDMLLGFTDRTGHQMGYKQRNTTTGSTLYNGYIGGDLLRAHKNGNTWVLENNGTVGSLTSAGANNGQGPSTPTSTGYTSSTLTSGEFYFQENYSGTNGGTSVVEIHQETFMGSALSIPGLNQTIATVMDPLDVFTGGFSWFSNTTGDDIKRAELYASGTDLITFGKANGLGVIKALCNPAPIEIGNRVWIDANDNGVQDPGELPLAGVKVTLTGPGLTAPVSVTTNSSGEYYFSNGSGTAATGFAYSLTGLTSGSSYSLTFPTSASAGALVLSSKPSSATGTNTDAIDTDPNASGLITFTLGQSGQNNFTYDAGYTTPACSLSLTPTISGCYSTTAGSKATVSVEVAWSNAPANDYIVVTTGAQSRTITPGLITITYPQVVGTLTGQSTIVSPQVVAFEVDANSSTSSITARFFSTTNCQATASFTAPAPCLPTACATGSDLGGMIFKDFNDSGTQETGETAGLPDVTVKAIACDGTVYTTTSDAYGRYTLSIPPGNYPVRVEFTNLPAVYNSAINGSNSRTTVQFVNAPSCTVNLGVNNPVDYCSNTPDIFVPCYVYGDPLITGGSSATSAALVSIPYGVSSLTFQGENPLTSASKIGTVWGAAYNRTTKKLFLSAVLKRHAGLGPAGLGGIYITDYSNPASTTTTTFLSVSTIGINVGTIPSNSARGLSGDKTQPSRDPESFSLTAKAGIGDLEISEDGNKLWLVNLNDKKLYSIDITKYNADGTTKPTAADVNSFAIPATCTNGEFRPWALKVYNGKVYIGGVCDAQASGNKSDLRASVFELNGSTFSKIFDFPLTYPKGYPAAANRNVTGWFPWTDTFDDLLDGSTILRHPVPMFTDIEFDIDGSMVLAFGDRTGFQGGDRNYRPDGTSTTLYETNSQAGDLLRAFYSNGAFVLENNAKAGPNIGYGVNNAQGPGFGEFYNDNWVQEGGTNVLYHAEEVMGGLALKPGSGEVAVTTIDPVDGHPYAGGVRYMNNKTGQVTGSYAVYITRGPDGSPNPGTFAKATGLGDIELSCNSITLLEIGNRVWSDVNKDGVQDACEPALANVKVSLYRSGSLVASTTTNANGEYYFNNSPVSSTVAGTVSTTGLLPNTAYQIVFGSTQFSNSQLTVNGNTYLLTQANSTTTNANDSNDSDALVATVAGITAPVISLTTGAAGSVNHTYDAGFIQTASLGDFVFEDKNANGVQDAADLPIAGVNVTLYINGTASLTTTTNSSGLYSFTGLTPGSNLSYTVGFGQPAGYTAITANVGSDEAKDSDGNPATGITGVYTLTAGENNTTIDMGYVKPASLGDFVFVDANKNGIQDTGEAPIPGVTVTLYTNGVVSATTVTNASGLYSFTGLTPGKSLSYAVGFTTPNGYTATTPLSGTNKAIDSDPVNGITASVTLSSGENNPTLDAGFYILPASLGDFVFEDTNRNGIQDSNEPGLPGVVATLYVNNVASLTTTTDATGFYSFTGLTPGSSLSYAVGFTQPAGYTATLQNIGDDTKDSDADPVTGKTQSVTLAPAEFNPTLDAGFYLPSAGLGDYVFYDTNKDGIQDSGEAGIENAVVTLYANGVVLKTTTTDATGFYSFTGLTPGSSLVYVVGFTTPSGYSATIQNAGSDDAKDSDADPITGKTQSVTLAPGEFNPTLDAGFFTPSAGLGDFVFIDANKNGIQDADESPILGVTVTLYVNGTASLTTTTDASGFYSFTGLTPGSSLSYSVGFTTPTGYTATLANIGNDAKDSDADPVTGLTQSITLAASEFNPTLDAGFYMPSASLGDYVWLDINKDGYQQSGEPGISGVTVTLVSNGTVVASTTTNASGIYSFTGLTPGVPYSVSFVAPAGYQATGGSDGAVDDAINSDANPITGATRSVTLAPGENNPNLDAGFFIPSAGLGDFVFIDTNKNGVQDSGEPGLGGVVATLYVNTVASLTTTTDASGLYSFTGLTPGSSLSYSVGFTQPAGYTATLQNVGDDTKDSDADLITGKTQSVTLAPGEFNPTLDAGFYIPSAGLGDFVFIDTNKNGVQDSGEPGLAGVVATLYVNNVASLTTTTNASGFYSFTGLTPGSSVSYSVGFTQPAGYTATLQNVGDDTKDSDADLITGKTQSVTLAPGEFNPTLDAGFYIPSASLGDFVFTDTNQNGIQDTGEPGIPGVTVTLVSNGTVVTSTTTNASGVYSFTGLTPGVPYSVSFTTPVGYTATLAQQGGDDNKDSDINPITGVTRSVTLAPGENNPNLDAGFYIPAPQLSLDKLVDKTRAKLGDVLTYTLILTNTGITTASNVVVTDSSTTGLSYITGSASAPAGTTYSPGIPNSHWTVATIGAGQSLSLTFQAKADSAGILYNKAYIPGDTATVCTSIPVRVCAGEDYVFQLTVPAGRSRYRWFRNDVELTSQTTNVLEVTMPGTYSLAADNLTGTCPDFSCCPFIVEEDSLPTFQAKAIPVTCLGNTTQANGQLILSGFTSTDRYQYSLGTSFNVAASLSGVAKVIPADGVLVSNLVNPTVAQAYTVRVYNSSGCFIDQTVLLLPTICGCPADVCVPFVLKQTKRPQRIGDAR